jgi:hypothetical protein
MVNNGVLSAVAVVVLKCCVGWDVLGSEEAQARRPINLNRNAIVNAMPSLNGKLCWSSCCSYHNDFALEISLLAPVIDQSADGSRLGRVDAARVRSPVC